MVERAIRSILINATAVQAKTGPRIRVGSLRQGDGYPGIILGRDNDERPRSNAGPLDATRAEVQIDVVSATSAQESIELAEDVRLALDGFTGTADSIVIQSTEMQTSADEFIPSRHGDAESPANDQAPGAGYFRRTLRFAVWFNQPLAA